MTKKFTIHIFSMETPDPHGNPGPWEISSVVVNPEEFEEMLSAIQDGPRPTIFTPTNGGGTRNGGRVSPQVIESFRKARHIPMLSRGTMTDHLFRMFDVKTSFMSVIVRGEGLDVAARYGLLENPDAVQN